MGEVKHLRNVGQRSVGRSSNRRNNNVNVIRGGTYKCPPTNCTSVFYSDFKYKFYFFITNFGYVLSCRIYKAPEYERRAHNVLYEEK